MFLDHVQFTRRDWRTRNAIKTARGLVWLSVPVKAKNHLDLKVADVLLDSTSHWAEKHLRSIEQAYSQAPFLSQIIARIRATYEHPPTLLMDLNRSLTRICWEVLSAGQHKRFIGDEELGDLTDSDKNTRLIEICKRVGATNYLSGPSAKEYILPAAWDAAGIKFEYIAYNYRAYPQLHGDFLPHVSILDVLMNLGPGSLDSALAPQALSKE